VGVLLHVAGGGCASTMDNAVYATLADVPGTHPYYA
jgi:hypothetical protein